MSEYDPNCYFHNGKPWYSTVPPKCICKDRNLIPINNIPIEFEGDKPNE